MLKPGLGKGLGDLMQGDQVAGKNSGPDATPRPDQNFGRGLETLIRPDATEPAGEGPRNRPLLPPWFFFAADLLLLAHTVAIAFDAPRPFNVGTVLFCAVSIALGGTLAIIGVLQALNRG